MLRSQPVHIATVHCSLKAKISNSRKYFKFRCVTVNFRKTVESDNNISLIIKNFFMISLYKPETCDPRAGHNLNKLRTKYVTLWFRKENGLCFHYISLHVCKTCDPGWGHLALRAII